MQRSMCVEIVLYLMLRDNQVSFSDEPCIQIIIVYFLLCKLVLLIHYPTMKSANVEL